MSENDNPLPCPFCGEYPVLRALPREGGGWELAHNNYVNSPECFASGVNWFETYREAIAAWNRRAQPASGEQAPTCPNGHGSLEQIGEVLPEDENEVLSRSWWYCDECGYESKAHEELVPGEQGGGEVLWEAISDLNEKTQEYWQAWMKVDARLTALETGLSVDRAGLQKAIDYWQADLNQSLREYGKRLAALEE